MKKKLSTLFTTFLMLSTLNISITKSCDEENKASSASRKGPTEQEDEDKILNKFLKECLKYRAIAIRTPRTIIAPLSVNDLGHMLQMYKEKETNFVQPNKDLHIESELVQQGLQLIAYGNMDQGVKATLKITDYSIFVVDLSSEMPIIFAGLYSIAPPDDEGWSKSEFILKKKLRSKGLGEEVKKAIYNDIIKDLIGTQVQLIEFETDCDNPNALFIRNPSITTNVLPNRHSVARSKTSNIVFKGLQGWVHIDNQSSIKLNNKCGWVESYREIKIDLEGNSKEHILYRSPSPTS
jgi:hypothetical protein